MVLGICRRMRQWPKFGRRPVRGVKAGTEENAQSCVFLLLEDARVDIDDLTFLRFLLDWVLEVKTCPDELHLLGIDDRIERSHCREAARFCAGWRQCLPSPARKADIAPRRISRAPARQGRRGKRPGSRLR